MRVEGEKRKKVREDIEWEERKRKKLGGNKEW